MRRERQTHCLSGGCPQNRAEWDVTVWERTCVCVCVCVGYSTIPLTRGCVAAKGFGQIKCQILLPHRKTISYTNTHTSRSVPSLLQLKAHHGYCKYLWKGEKWWERAMKQSRGFPREVWSEARLNKKKIYGCVNSFYFRINWFNSTRTDLKSNENVQHRLQLRHTLQATHSDRWTI